MMQRKNDGTALHWACHVVTLEVAMALMDRADIGAKHIRSAQLFTWHVIVVTPTSWLSP
jgi:hypothetical protein